MSSGSIRIIQLPEKSSVNTDDYMAVDSSANGTKKVKFPDLLNYVTPEMFGAVGDGITDDSNALQECINYAFANKLIVFLPAKTYGVSIPIYVKGAENNAQFGTFLMGSSRGQSVIKALSTMESVLYLGTDTDTTVSAITVSYVHVNANNKANKGISQLKSTANINVSDVKISNCLEYGFYSSDDLYLSTFVRVRIDNCTLCGFYMTLDGTNTSCNFINCYVQTSQNGYKLQGIYMNMDNCCADSITDTVLDLTHFIGTVNSFGSEAYNAKTMFKGGRNTDVVVNGALTWGNFDDSEAVHIYCTGNAKLTFVGGKVLYDWREQGRTAPGKMYYTVSYCSLRFINVEYAASTGNNFTNNIYFDNQGWDKQTQHKGTATYDLPSFFNELLFEVTDANVRMTIHLVRQELSSYFLHFYTGFYSNAGSYCQIDVSDSQYKLVNCSINGSDISSSAYITCYYK